MDEIEVVDAFDGRLARCPTKSSDTKLAESRLGVRLRGGQSGQKCPALDQGVEEVRPLATSRPSSSVAPLGFHPSLSDPSEESRSPQPSGAFTVTKIGNRRLTRHSIGNKTEKQKWPLPCSTCLTLSAVGELTSLSLVSSSLREQDELPFPITLHECQFIGCGLAKYPA